jgi:hypothetical protein
VRARGESGRLLTFAHAGVPVWTGVGKSTLIRRIMSEPVETVKPTRGYAVSRPAYARARANLPLTVGGGCAGSS